MRKNCIIRRTTQYNSGAGSSYAIERADPVGRSLGGAYRFSKTARIEAMRFDAKTAQKVLKSMQRTDPLSGDSAYTVVKL